MWHIIFLLILCSKSYVSESQEENIKELLEATDPNVLKRRASIYTSEDEDGPSVDDIADSGKEQIMKYLDDSLDRSAKFDLNTTISSEEKGTRHRSRKSKKANSESNDSDDEKPKRKKRKPRESVESEEDVEKQDPKSKQKSRKTRSKGSKRSNVESIDKDSDGDSIPIEKKYKPSKQKQYSTETEDIQGQRSAKRGKIASKKNRRKSSKKGMSEESEDQPSTKESSKSRKKPKTKKKHKEYTYEENQNDMDSDDESVSKFEENYRKKALKK